MLTFQEALLATPFEPLSHRHVASLADAWNDRLRSGLGDCAWRFHFWMHGAVKALRNPDDLLFPSLLEYFEAYQMYESGDLIAWPLAGPGDPEGINTNNPLGGFTYGNEGASLDNETDRLGIAMDVGGEPPASVADFWALHCAQAGWIDPDTGIGSAPAVEAARKFGSIAYSLRSPHLKGYGGYLAGPEEVVITEGEFLNYRFFSNNTGAHPHKSYPFNDGTITWVAAYITEDAYNFYVVLVDATNSDTEATDILPKSVYSSGARGTSPVLPGYDGDPLMSKVSGQQLGQVLSQFASDFRGSIRKDAPELGLVPPCSVGRSELTANPTGGGAYLSPSHPGVFDFQQFGCRQYVLAPSRNSTTRPKFHVDAPGTDPYTVVADTVLEISPGITAHGLHASCCLAAIYVKTTALASGCTISARIDGVAVLTAAVTPDVPAVILTLPDPPDGSAVTVTVDDDVTFTGSSGKIEVEISELLRYKPDLSDAYLVLRLGSGTVPSGDEMNGSGVDEADARKISENLWARACVTNLHGETELPATPDSAINQNAVIDAFRRMSRVIRVVPPGMLVDYEVDSAGRSVLYFKRVTIGTGSESSSATEVFTGGLVAGGTYEVRGSVGYGNRVEYNGNDYLKDERFTPAFDVDEATLLDEFTTYGDATLWFIPRGLMDAGGKDGMGAHVGMETFRGIADEIVHLAPPHGQTNEWLLEMGSCGYRNSYSSAWKPEVLAYWVGQHNRAGFMAPEIAKDEALLNQVAYGQSMGNWGNMTCEMPSGFNYVRLSGSFYGGTHLNQYADEDAATVNPLFFKSCPIYQKPCEVEDAIYITESGQNRVKVTLTGRLQSTHGETSGAPATIARGFGYDPSSEPYRTDENAILEYLRGVLRGGSGNASVKVGDHAVNSLVDTLGQPPYGSVVPKFFLSKLVPIPFLDSNDDADPTDTVAWHDSLAQCRMLTEACCGGFVDAQFSADTACARNAGRLYMFNYENLCQQAFGHNRIGCFPDTSTAYIPTLETRPDNPFYLGPLPNTYISAGVFNQLAKSVNLLTAVPIYCPSKFETRTNRWRSDILVTPEGNSTADSGSSYGYWSGNAPSPATLIYTDDWHETDEEITGGCDVQLRYEHGTGWLVYQIQEQTEWRYSPANPDFLLACHPDWRDMVSGDVNSLQGAVGYDHRVFTTTLSAGETVIQPPEVGNTLWHLDSHAAMAVTTDEGCRMLSSGAVGTEPITGSVSLARLTDTVATVSYDDEYFVGNRTWVSPSVSMPDLALRIPLIGGITPSPESNLVGGDLDAATEFALDFVTGDLDTDTEEAGTWETGTL